MINSRLLNLSFSLGLLGGAWMCAAHFTFAPGKQILIAGAVLVLVTIAILRSEQISNYRTAFFSSLIAFLLSFLSLYAFVATATGTLEVGFLGNLWRIGFAALVAVLLAAPSGKIVQSPPLQA